MFRRLMFHVIEKYCMPLECVECSFERKLGETPSSGAQVAQRVAASA